MNKIVNILIADDHAIVLKGVKTILEGYSHFKIVAEAKTGEEAVQKAQECQPDVAVLDIRMPGLSGIETCRQIISIVPTCKIIMLTAYAEDDMLFAAVQAGAVGYVLKRAGENDIVHAIERVSYGEAILDPSMTTTLFESIRQASRNQLYLEFATLTPQEMLVLALLTKGMTNRQIATRLYLGEGTIRNYVSSVLSKLSLSNRAEAAAFATKHSIDGLVTC
jgi:DNA-binding NarL/FixJ family response regulator